MNSEHNTSVTICALLDYIHSAQDRSDKETASSILEKVLDGAVLDEGTAYFTEAICRSVAFSNSLVGIDLENRDSTEVPLQLSEINSHREPFFAAGRSSTRQTRDAAISESDVLPRPEQRKVSLAVVEQARDEDRRASLFITPLRDIPPITNPSANVLQNPQFAMSDRSTIRKDSACDMGSIKSDTDRSSSLLAPSEPLRRDLFWDPFTLGKLTGSSHEGAPSQTSVTSGLTSHSRDEPIPRLDMKEWLGAAYWNGFNVKPNIWTEVPLFIRAEWQESPKPITLNFKSHMMRPVNVLVNFDDLFKAHFSTSSFDVGKYYAVWYFWKWECAGETFDISFKCEAKRHIWSRHNTICKAVPGKAAILAKVDDFGSLKWSREGIYPECIQVPEGRL